VSVLAVEQDIDVAGTEVVLSCVRLNKKERHT
jgi:hypothetical protein